MSLSILLVRDTIIDSSRCTKDNATLLRTRVALSTLAVIVREQRCAHNTTK